MQIIDTLFCFINLVHLLFIDLCKKNAFVFVRSQDVFMFFSL